jgi:tetratricopeptide (TPR) repeat protein
LNRRFAGIVESGGRFEEKPMARRRWVLASLLLASSAAVACLWDYDTLLAERARQPTTLELITGKFLRHSPRFYDWRRQDRLAKIEAGANAEALWDDLAVAYDKLGQHDQAIETARQRLIENPRRYETLANLGTFYLHSGQLQEGITTIDKALEVNPAAHFGRERIQRYLAEYILQR